MYRLAFLVLIASVSANHCPTVHPVDNFRFEDYAQGIWYEVARYPTPAEEGSECGHAEYTKVGDEIKVKNYFVRNNKAAIIEGTGKLAPDAGKTGKILFKLPYGPRGAPIYSILNILAIDYDKYLVGYYCKFDEASQTRKDFAWVLSRSKNLSADSKAAVDKFLKESELLDAEKFTWPSFSDEACRVDNFINSYINY